MTDDALAKLLEPLEEPIRDKLLHVIQLIRSNLPEAPVDVFVSTSPGSSSVSYDGVWVFTPNFVSEIRRPLTSGRVQHEVARLKGLVDWVRLTARDFEFQEPRQESQLDLEFTTSDGYSGTLTGTGAGCERLMEVYRKHFLGNITAPN